ncbi:DUF3954 domain-containing protein [Sporolactobacillus shoreicorticis]|uniref:DUF3954 domain-containing protein n=1 Tax=Sporolactobacillus shoreicorticis TaxID=1923877 RepID=A0ABW5RZI3_9BACL|nr:DUF3954 domain-containing protein [Sporolactobacillus shoreicorticis]MCO7128325.1 DUF3954 domain-containing protein [Sporolactobacillus shoreicorticis]
MKQNIETMKAEIDLMENAMYLVCDGHLTKVRAQEFGSTEIAWKEGKWLDVIQHERQRNCGQDVI